MVLDLLSSLGSRSEPRTEDFVLYTELCKWLVRVSNRSLSSLFPLQCREVKTRTEKKEGLSYYVIFNRSERVVL